LSEILTDFNYDAATVARVCAIVRKEHLRDDPEVQILEDVICIVFIKFELDRFAAKYAGREWQLAEILAKTWRKMSERGQAATLAIPPAPSVTSLLHRGLELTKPSKPA
jgi:hypothetical protein